MTSSPLSGDLIRAQLEKILASNSFHKRLHSAANAPRLASFLPVTVGKAIRGEADQIKEYDVSLVHIGLGNKDQSFEWLTRACEERFGWSPYHIRSTPLRVSRFS